MRRTFVVLILALVLGGCREQRVVDRDRPPAVPDAAIAPVDPLTDAYLTRFIAAHHSDDWYGFHIQDRKVGSANLTMRPTAPGEPGAYAVTMAMALQVEGADGGTSYTQTSFYAGTPPFTLVALHKRETSGASVAESTYVCGPDGIDVTATADGQAAPSRRLPPTRETLASAVSELALPADVAIGLRMSHMAFDSDAGLDQPKTVIVDRAVDETLAGVKVRVVTVSSHDDGNDALSNLGQLTIEAPPP